MTTSATHSSSESHTCWIYKRDGIPVKADSTGRPCRYSVAAVKREAAMSPGHRAETTRRLWVGRTPDQRADIARKANESRSPEARSAAGKKSRESMTPEARSAAARKGHETSEALGRSFGLGKKGYLLDVYTASMCERRVLVHQHLTHPDATVRRFKAGLDGEFRNPGWVPDLVVEHPDGMKRVIEVKWLVGYPTRVSAQDVADASGKTAGNIVAKSRAHPSVEIWNGESREMIDFYSHARANDLIPPFVPNKPGDKDE